jgi:hypothetical protein
MEFNDYSVLEMNSLREAFKIMQSSDADFLADCSKTQQRAFRKTVIDLVLATDMAHHFDVVGKFTTKVGNDTALAGLTGGDKWLAMNEEQRMLTLKLALKVSDIGHCFTELEQHQNWSALLEGEFFEQGDLEKEKNLPVSPLMDREKPG